MSAPTLTAPADAKTARHARVLTGPAPQAFKDAFEAMFTSGVIAAA